MAVKIVHKRWRQELRFGDRATAEHYAEQEGGGLDKWRVVTVSYQTAVNQAAAVPLRGDQRAVFPGFQSRAIYRGRAQ